LTKSRKNAIMPEWFEQFFEKTINLAFIKANRAIAHHTDQCGLNADRYGIFLCKSVKVSISPSFVRLRTKGWEESPDTRFGIISER